MPLGSYIPDVVRDLVHAPFQLGLGERAVVAAAIIVGTDGRAVWYGVHACMHEGGAPCACRVRRARRVVCALLLPCGSVLAVREHQPVLCACTAGTSVHA